MKILSNILKLRHEAEQSISTLPALMMSAEKISGAIIHGMHSQRKSGMGEKFWQFRHYQQTDSLQDIDWRQSAKADNIFIKQKEWQTTQKTYLWCASGSSMDFTSDNKIYTKRACAQIITLSLALLLRHLEEQIGMFGDLKTGNSESRMQKIAYLLMNNDDMEENLPDTKYFELPSHSSFIAVGDFLSNIDEIGDCFSSIALSTQNALIIQILDPEELNLNYQGRVKFQDTDTKQSTIINHVPSVRDEYKRRIKQHIDNIEKLCHECGWHYILHRTDKDITQTLEKIWMMLNIERAAS